MRLGQIYEGSRVLTFFSLSQLTMSMLDSNSIREQMADDTHILRPIWPIEDLILARGRRKGGIFFFRLEAEVPEQLIVHIDKLPSRYVVAVNELDGSREAINEQYAGCHVQIFTINFCLRTACGRPVPSLPRCLAPRPNGIRALMDFNPRCLTERPDGWLVFNVQNETGQ